MKEEKFEKVLNQKDVFAIGFGAMIGWGWVIMAGDWILGAGSLGAVCSFLLGGLMVLFVGLVYAELTSAMPECGGVHVFSMRGLGKNASFVCSWSIILAYVGVVAFEAVAFPTVIQHIFPKFLQGYMYTVAGFDVYASWVVVAIAASLFITAINFFGAESAAKLQNALTIAIAVIGIALVAGSAASGNPVNLFPMFTDGAQGVLGVAVMTPFMLVGFDVIPQAAEEINVPVKKIGKIMVFSIAMAVLWYVLIVLAVAFILPKGDMASSILPTADAMKMAFWNSNAASNILVLGGMAGIVTSWNSFFMGGSRAIFSLAESKMLPGFLTKLHPKHKTPVNAVLLIGGISCIAPFFGRQMMVWITDAGGFGICVTYLLVSCSFLALRKNEPEMERPYKIRHGKFVGCMAVLMSGFMALLYILPGFSSALTIQEWVIVGGWAILGIVFFVWAKARYVEEFGVHHSRLERAEAVAEA